MLKKEAREITGGLSKPSKMPGPAHNLPAQACKTGAKLVKIPGSVGAAPIQNIGAYGAEVADFIEYVLVWDARGKERTLSRDECLFGYRSSIFQLDTELTVAGVGLRLGKIPKPNISYPDVSNALSGRPE